MKCRADSDHVVEPILKYVLSLMNFIGFVRDLIRLVDC